MVGRHSGSAEEKPRSSGPVQCQPAGGIYLTQPLSTWTGPVCPQEKPRDQSIVWAFPSPCPQGGLECP